MSHEKLSAAQVTAKIAEAGATWSAGVSSLSELKPDEQAVRLGYTPGPGEPSLADRERLASANLARLRMAPSAEGRPAGYDLRNVDGKNFVTPVKDQGSCGSCVAFGTCATVEGTARVAKQDPNFAIDLSEAQLFYCIAREQGRTCANGWWVSAALDAFKGTGVADEPCYPYTAGDQNCANRCADWASRVTKIGSWTALTDIGAMKDWLAAKGPIAACFSVYSDFFSYHSGVYRHVTGGLAGGHCICVVGYDDAAQCWICKNSWGTGWGESGFFRIAYGECGIDSTMWGVDIGAPSKSLPLFRYWNGPAGDHFYTTSWAELGAGAYGWAYEGIQCYVFPAQEAGTVPLYRYWNGPAGDHFYTTSWAELGAGAYGWAYEGIQCYVYPNQVPGTVPLYRYWNGRIADHFYTTSWAELGAGASGWVYEGIQCYVLPAPAGSSARGPCEGCGTVPETFRTSRNAMGGEEMSRVPASFQIQTSEAAVPSTFQTQSPETKAAVALKEEGPVEIRVIVHRK